jgi:ribose transport system substrate-binding protein
VMHAPGSASTMDREQGFTEVLAAEAPGLQIVATQYGMSDRSKARSAAENILTAHPDLAAIFASSEPSSVGTSLAIQGRGLTDKVVLVAFDASDTMIEDLRSGAIDAMIVQDAYRMGFEAVKTLVDKINGKTPPKRLDLHAATVQVKNLEEPEIKRLLNLK